MGTSHWCSTTLAVAPQRNDPPKTNPPGQLRTHDRSPGGGCRRRSATRAGSRSYRGLKSTATFNDRSAVTEAAIIPILLKATVVTQFEKRRHSEGNSRRAKAGGNGVKNR